MATVTRKYPKDEFVRRGQEMFAKAVQPHLTDEDHGRFVAVDIDTGEYAIDDDRFEAGERLRERLPLSQMWLERVGYPGVVRFGFLRKRADV